MSEKRRILIVNPFGIGDVLFLTPLIKNLRFYYPEAFITVALQRRTVAVLEDNPNVNKIIVFSRGDFKIISYESKIKAIKTLVRTLTEVFQERFDLYFDLSLEHRYSLFLKFFGVKPRIGYNYKNRGRFLTHRFDIEGYIDKHIVEYHLGLLKFLGLKPKFWNPEFFLKPEQKDWGRDFLRKSGINKEDLIIGVVPFGGESFGRQVEIRRWPIENHARLCDMLINRLDARIVILAGPKEKESIGRLSSIMCNKVVDTTQTTITQLAAVIANCRLVISNDAGPLHLAKALNIPTISLFGPVNEKVYGPYPPSPEHVVMKKDFPCRPCYQKFHIPKCNYHQRCLRSITVQEVFQKVEELLKVISCT